MKKTVETEGTGGIARHAGIYAIGNVVRQLAGFVMLPIYTRYLSPADYGAVGLLALALALLEPFFGARLTQAIPRFYFLEQGEKTRQAVIVSALCLTASVSAITAALIWMFSGPASEVLFGTREYALATALFGLNILTQPIEYSGMTFIRMQQRSVLFLVVSLTKLAVQIGLNLYLVIYLDLGVVGVILSGVIASAAFGAGLTAYTLYYNRPRLDFGIAWKMLIFSWPLWFAGLAGLYTGSSSRFFLRIFGSLESVGLIELGARFASIISLLIWTPFSQHWDVVSYRLYAEKRAEKPFQAAFLIIGCLLLTSGLGISIFSEPVIDLMADAAFDGAAPTVPFLTLAFVFTSLAGFFSFGFLVTDHTRMVSYAQYFMAVVITIFFVLLIPPFREVGAALAQCLAAIATFIFIHKVSRSYFDPGIRLLPFWFGVGLCVASYVLCISLPHGESWIRNVAIDAIVYALTCAILFWLTAAQLRKVDPAAYETIRNMVNTVAGKAGIRLQPADRTPSDADG
jgi:O-antigen/teichoic acid export membrane protein